MKTIKLKAQISVLVGLAASIAGAQTSGDAVLPYKQLSTGAGVAMSTTDFNPQIVEHFELNPRPLTPNEGLPSYPTGPGNSLKAGSVTTKVNGKLRAKFPGIGFTGWVPPDPEIAVGPNFIVSTVNSDIAFFNKTTGAKTFQQSMDASGFFSGIGVTSNFTFDPKCFFDKLSQRFFVIICEQDDATTTSKMLLAVSDDADPAGTWYKYRIESKATDGGNDYWLDYPGFGYNKDAIVFTGNMFPFASGGVFTQVVVIPKAPLLNGGAANAQYLKDNTMFTVQPSRVPEIGQANIYGVTALNSTTIRLVALTNLLATPTLLKKDVAVPSWTRPNAVPAAGGRLLDGLDGRLYNCHFRGGRLVTAHTTKANDGRMQSRWYEFSVNTWPASGSPSLRQSGNILLSGTNSHMPAINTNAAGDISVIYSRNNASTNPEICQSSRLAVDALGTIGAPQVLATSTGNYGSAGGNRWGDYFGCEVDPVDNLTFWGIGMAAGAGGQWQTHINKWTVSSGAGATIEPPVSIVTTQGNFVIGDVPAISNSDNNRYSIQSVLIDKFGVPTFNANLATAMVATAQVDFDLDMSQGTLDDLKVAVETNVSKVGASGQIFAYNWVSGTYVSIASFAVSTTDKKALISVKKTQLSSFVDGTGNVRLLIRSIASVKAGRPGILPPPFQFNIDQIGLSPTFTS